MVATQLGDLSDRAGVVVDRPVSAADHPVDQVGDQVDEERAVSGGYLREVVPGSGRGTAGERGATPPAHCPAWKVGSPRIFGEPGIL